MTYGLQLLVAITSVRRSCEFGTEATVIGVQRYDISEPGNGWEGECI